MLLLHPNTHQCPHLVPSVGCPSASALAFILVHYLFFFFLVLPVVECICADLK